MSHEPVPPGDAFEAKLAALRARIDRLPPEQRPHLYDLADAIARHRRHVEEMRAAVDGTR